MPTTKLLKKKPTESSKTVDEGTSTPDSIDKSGGGILSALVHGTAKVKHIGSDKEIDYKDKDSTLAGTNRDLEKISANDFMKQKSSKSQRFTRAARRRPVASKGFGGSTRRKRI